jgi:two-component system cell cycle sensor histidine kinase/response regulator CckA
VDDLVASIQRLIPEDIRVEVDLEPVPTIVADPSLLSHAILNMVINARDAMATGGTLTLRVRAVSPKGAVPGTENDERTWVLLEVQDTGEGMDEETRKRAFEPFFSTKKQKGTGLGLASVWGIVQQSSGHIAVESAPGQGSLFRVWFPPGEVSEPAARVPESAALAPSPSRQATVLVIEDQASVRTVLVRALERSGMRVLSAEDGSRALDVARATPRIDLVCTDGIMPGKPTHEMIASEHFELAPRSPVTHQSSRRSPSVAPPLPIQVGLPQAERARAGRRQAERCAFRRTRGGPSAESGCGRPARRPEEMAVNPAWATLRPG